MAGPDELAVQVGKKKHRMKDRENREVVLQEEAEAEELERLLFGARDDFVSRLPEASASGDASRKKGNKKRKSKGGEESGTRTDPEEESGWFIDRGKKADEAVQETSEVDDPSVEDASSEAFRLPLPAWVDEDDERISVDIGATDRLRKLRRTDDEVRICGSEYQERLREQHLRLNPASGWAQLPAKPQKLTPGRDGAGDAGEAGALGQGSALNSEATQLLQSSKALVGPTTDRLLPGRIELSRLRNANQEDPSKSVLRSVHFHPNGQLMLTAGFDKKLRLFQVNGRENPEVQSVFLQDMPIFKARFCAGGAKVLLSGRRKWFYMYDLVSGAVERVQGIAGLDESSLESFEVDPTADVAAFLCNEGHVELVSVKSRQWIGEVKLNGSVRCAAFAGGGRQLVASGGDGEIYHWDLRTLRCLHRAKDEGSLGCTSLAVSPNGEFLASGSSSGVVNVYRHEALLSGAHRPLKALMNLTTTVDSLAFSPDAQILGMASRMKKDALRLVHLPSCRVFPNWPTAQSLLQYVHCMDFGSTRGLFCVGNAKGQALLYRLHHYSKG